MAELKTVQIGESVLRETAAAVTDFADPALQLCVTDLTDTMRAEDIVGIAALRLVFQNEW